MNPKIIRVIVHMQGSACLDTAGDAIAGSRTMNVPTALQGHLNAASLTSADQFTL